MNIFDFAIEKEKQSRKIYLELAEKSPSKGLTNIFTMLADEENKHLDIVNSLKTEVPKRVTGTDVIGDARQVFEKMQAGKEQFDLNTGELEIYKKARQVELDSKKYYIEKAEGAEDDGIANVLTKLAKEEDKHYRLIDAIIEMVSRPRQWLENAEWYHIEEY